MAMIRTILAMLVAGPAAASISVVPVVEGVIVSVVECRRVGNPYPVPHAPSARQQKPARGPEIACVEWEGDRCARRSIQMEWRAK